MARARVYLYFNSFVGFPGSDKCQHRKWPLEHVIRGVIRGVIHQKLRLELIQHAGYLNLVMGSRCVFRILIPFFFLDTDVCREPAHGDPVERARGSL